MQRIHGLGGLVKTEIYADAVAVASQLQRGHKRCPSRKRPLPPSRGASATRSS